MRNRWCRRPETTRADHGTSDGPLSSLPSLPAGWPRNRATTRARFSKLVNCVTLFSQAAAAGVGNRTAHFWQGRTLDGCLASGGEV